MNNINLGVIPLDPYNQGLTYGWLALIVSNM